LLFRLPFHTSVEELGIFATRAGLRRESARFDSHYKSCFAHSSDTLRMTGFATWARGHHPQLLKTPKIKVTEKANKKQTLISP
jgi:hypothetical protein